MKKLTPPPTLFSFLNLESLKTKATISRVVFLFLCIMLCQLSALAQFTSNGINDTIFDKEGNKFAIVDQMINPPSGYYSSNLRPAAIASCSAGYFNLYFAPNSAFTTGANALAHQNVICQVFTDISNFINSPLAAPSNTVRVNIFCGNTPASSPFTIGSATSYYIVPLNPTSTNPGLTDNTIFKAITTGIDPYTLVNVAFSSSPSNFYHGVVNLNPAFTYNTNLNTTVVPANQDDLYAIMLHEALHALGFASLIDNNGMSRLGTANNYYASYDKFLANSSNAPLLTSTISSCSTGNMIFSGALTQICPGTCTSNISSNLTNCTQAARFIAPGVNVAVYTPNCWESGSSLSHFEDICSVPVGFSTTCTATPPNNDMYYAMSNANGGGTCGVKRLIQEEERLALCNIGYSVKSINASPVAGAAYTYTGGACSGAPVIGVDDGIVNGVYTYVANNFVSIPVSTILGNDISSSPLNLNCLSLVYNPVGIVFSVANGSLNVTKLGNGACGLVTLKYIPTTNAGVMGNPTYIYVYFNCPSNCNPSNSCDLVQNGGFESKIGSNNVYCGGWGVGAAPAMTSTNVVDCWAFNETNSANPDIFTKNCAGIGQQIGGASAASIYSISNTYNTIPTNQTAIGIGASVGSNINEYLRNRLSAPLVPTNTYVVSFWVLKSNFISSNDFVVTFLSAPNFSSAMGIGTSSVFPGTYNVLANFTVTNLPVGVWAKQTATVVFNSSGNIQHNAIILGFDAVASAALPNGSSSGYLIFDDVSILPLGASVSFNLPDARCSNNSIIDLGQYAGNFLNGVFTGSGVTQSGGIYNFNSPPTLPAGLYNIALTYTTAGGCVNTVNSITNVSGITTTTNSATCSGGNYTLAASNFAAATTYTWLPTGSNSATIVVNPTVSTVYTLIAVSGSCTNQYTTAINVYATPTISPVSPICIGNLSNPLNANLVNGSPIGGTFSGNNILTQSCAPPFGNCFYINLLPPTTASVGVYNYTYTMPVNLSQNYNCPVSSTFNVQYLTPLNASINALPNNCFTNGQTYTLQSIATPTAGVSLSYTWQPTGSNTSSIVITPNSNSVYSLAISNGGCTTNASISVMVNNPPQLTNPPTQICTHQSINNLEQYLAISTPTGGTWSSPSGLATFFTSSVGITNLNVNPNLTPLGTHTITYSYAPPSNTTCLISNSFTINVSQGFALNASSSQTYCANIPSNSVVISATGTPVPPLGINYVWLPSGLVGASVSVAPTSNTIYTVTATSGVCSFTTTTQVDTRTNCCVAANYINTPTLATNINGGSYAINNDITITGNSLLSNAEFIMAPNVKITVLPNVVFNLGQVHFYSCNDMWKGIEVQTGGRIIAAKNSLFEDANTAIKSLGSNNINSSPNLNDVIVTECIFNRNLTAIQISNYFQPMNPAPYQFKGNVFTCRVLPFTATTWVNAGTIAPGLRTLTGNTVALVSPYNLQNYPLVNLKAPLTTLKSSIGIFVENVGTVSLITNNPPIYTSVMIGDDGVNDRYRPFNLFDNLYYGIYAKNGNVRSIANTFQNMTRNSFTGGGGQQVVYGGYGIYSTHDSIAASNNYLSTTHPSSSTVPNLGNWFYDCYVGVGLSNILTADVRYAEFKSTQSIINTPTNTLNLTGKMGISAYSNRVVGYKLNLNRMRNLETGIAFYGSSGMVKILPFNYIGRYMLDVLITDNEMTPSTSIAANPSVLRLGLGVYVASVNGASPQDYLSGAIRIENNKIIKAFRGVQTIDWYFNGHNAVVASNTISMVNDFITPSLPQYGVYAARCFNNSITSNSITGANITNSVAVGVYNSMNDRPQIQCNNVTNVFAGFEFASANYGTFWRDNTMTTNKRGLHLTSNAILGAQGSVNQPSDNKWNGTWTGNNGTWTDASSTATNSPLYVRTTNPYYPLNNSGINLQYFFGLVNNSLLNANNSAGILNCTTIGGGGGGGTVAAQMALLDDVATDNITYTVNVTETKEINKNMLYESVSATPTLTTASNILGSFYTTNQQATRGLYQALNSNLAQENVAQVSSLLNSFSPATQIEQNYKTYCEIASKYKSLIPLTTQDKSNLLVLCYQCPFTDGAVVYDARALYNQIYQTTEQYNDNNCVPLGYAWNRTNGANGSENSNLEQELANHEKAMKQKFTVTPVYELYPNPAQSEVSIYALNSSGKLEVTIQDVSGKILLQKTINADVNGTILELNLLNGIYFVNLINETGHKTVKKLIIGK